jgi:hypothetical protein
MALLADRIEELGARVSNGEKKTALAREFGISRETLYQYLRLNTGRKARTRLNGEGTAMGGNEEVARAVHSEP